MSSGQLKGRAELAYDDGGLRCLISAPLDVEWADTDHEVAASA
jgi:hypothetical protein